MLQQLDWDKFIGGSGESSGVFKLSFNIILILIQVIR